MCSSTHLHSLTVFWSCFNHFPSHTLQPDCSLDAHNYLKPTPSQSLAAGKQRFSLKVSPQIMTPHVLATCCPLLPSSCALLAAWSNFFLASLAPANICFAIFFFYRPPVIPLPRVHDWLRAGLHSQQQIFFIWELKIIVRCKCLHLLFSVW